MLVGLSQLRLNITELLAKTIAIILCSLQPGDLVGGSSQLSVSLKQSRLHISESQAKTIARIFGFTGHSLQLIVSPSPICDPTTSLLLEIFERGIQMGIVSTKLLNFFIHL
jgi:hypothetical protein